MASDMTVVDYDALRVAMSKFNSCKGALAEAYGAMKRAVEQVDSSWDGDASEAYVAKFNAIYANLTTSDPTIDQAVEGLQAALDAYIQAEEDNKRAMEAVEEVVNPFQG